MISTKEIDLISYPHTASVLRKGKKKHEPKMNKEVEESGETVVRRTKPVWILGPSLSSHAIAEVEVLDAYQSVFDDNCLIHGGTI